MALRHTALVIGAGLGGIAAAARLAYSGFKVTVLEKNPIPGGRCGQLVRDGHRFDIGPSLFLIPQMFAETCEDLGERMEDHLDLVRIDPTYHIHFDDGTQLNLTSDLKEMESQLEAIEPGSYGGFLRYMIEGHRHYHVSQYITRYNYDSFFEYFSLRNLPRILQLTPFARHYDHMGRYFQHPYLKEVFTYHDLYVGMNPYDAPPTYSLLPYTEFAHGVWFPVGGMYRIVESLVSIAEGYGAGFVYDEPVKQIQVDGDRATGVILQDGSTLDADVIVANADVPYVYRELLPDKADGNRLERMEYACSSIMFYWGVDKVCPQLRHHNLFLVGDHRSSFDRIFKDNALPDEPSFYLNAPSRGDPTAAPPNQDTLMVLVPAGHMNDAHPQDWHALQAHARSSVLRRLADAGLTDLENHLKFEVAYTPRTWLTKFNLTRGASLGSLSHNVGQIGYLRPPNRHRRYGNLYFVGSSTHPGSGLPLVLLSAQLTTERILEEVGAPQARRTVTSPSVTVMAQTDAE